MVAQPCPASPRSGWDGRWGCSPAPKQRCRCSGPFAQLTPPALELGANCAAIVCVPRQPELCS
eukprot:14683630-Alexandrium_andersonii.AAC.1